MENKTLAIIKGLIEEIESVSRDRDIYQSMYRTEKDRADKLEAAQKSKEDNF